MLHIKFIQYSFGYQLSGKKQKLFLIELFQFRNYEITNLHSILHRFKITIPRNDLFFPSFFVDFDFGLFCAIC